MRNIFRRSLSLLLMVVMVLSCVPAMALATEMPALPTATVTETKNDELTFAMNFQADPVTDEQLEYYGDWFADFELTINKEVTFHADGSADGYLSGRYDGSWGTWQGDWLKVPYTEAVTLEANKTLKIMEFAAQLMGQPGLKYTYSEVYNAVKDFECGVFFNEEFLQANPDLEVTLELRMYNPENEAESYQVSDTYSFVPDYVARNTTTDAVYESVADAMLEAAAGETVVLLRDAEEMHVMVLENTTLDLAGHTLTTQYFSGFGDIVDYSDANTGLLIPGRTLIEEDNKQLPVYDGTGYRFAEVYAFNRAVQNSGAKFVFQPLVESAVHQYLLAGSAVSDVQVMVDVSWVTSQGHTRTQVFQYSDSFVKQFVNSYNPSNGKFSQMFSLTLSAASEYSDLTYEAYVISGTGVRFSDTHSSPAPVPVPVTKFEAVENAPADFTTGTSVTVGELFAAKTGVEIDGGNVQVVVASAGEESTAGGTYAASSEDWAQGTLTFTGVGAAAITITDNNNCNPTTIYVTVMDREQENKFIANDVEAQLVGNSITLGQLFAAMDGATINSANVTVAVNGNTVVTGADWASVSYTFTAAGAYTFTITDNDYCVVTENTVQVDEEKFTVIENVGELEKENGTTLGQLFTAVDADKIDSDNLTVTVNGVEVEVGEDWTQSAVNFPKAGEITVTITDGNNCVVAENTVIVNEKKFAAKEVTEPIKKDDQVTLGDLFADLDDISFPIDSANVTIGNAAYAARRNAATEIYVNIEGAKILYNRENWKQSLVIFTSAGEITITITDNKFCTPTSVTVNVAKADPTDYTVPTGLTAVYGQTLTEVALPGGFAWQNPAASVGNAGTNSFTAVYTPADTANYNTVEVTVSVAVAKADPTDYTVPTGLTAIYGQTLAEVALPGGFAWQNPAASVGNVGTNSFTAVYTPADTANYNTVEVTVSVIVEDPTPGFAVKFPNVNQYMYRVGNKNAVSLNSLFTCEKPAYTGAVNVVVTDAAGKTLNVYTAGASWDKGQIDFADDYTGIVQVSIWAGSKEPTVLNLEVVDAINATAATSATANNVVLLNDCGFSSIEVKNGYYLYGNGFTITCGSDLAAAAMSYGFVELENGTLDNVQVVCPSFSQHVLYDSNMKEPVNQDPTAEWRYFNTRSAVLMKGNSRIVNSKISGGRAAVYVVSGNATIENTTIIGGTTANIHLVTAQHLLLKDVTLIQEPIAATVNDPGKVMMGFSVLVICDEDGAAAPITLEGELRQYAWANEDYVKNVNLPTGTDSIINTVLRQDAFKHNIPEIAEKPVLNLGIAYMPAEIFKSVNSNNVLNDNRTNQEAVPYSYATFSVFGTTARIYSYDNSKGTDASMSTKTDYAPSRQDAVLPTVKFTDPGEYREYKTTYDALKGWMSTLSVDVTSENYTFSFADLEVKKYGQALAFIVKNSNGSPIDKNQSIVLDNSGVRDYILEITDDLLYDTNGQPLVGESVTRTYHFTLVATKTNIEPPQKVAEVGGTPLLVAKGYDSDWSCAVPALEGTQIRYWSVAEKAYKTLSLSELTPASTGKQNGSNNYWTYTAANGDYSLTVTCGVIHEGKSVYGMPVVVNNGGNKMYFTISSTNGYVSTGTTARTVTISYEFKDNNGGTLTFNKTWNFVRQDQINAGAKQYSYSDFVNGKLTELTSGSGGCITPDTLITLADGTQVRVDALTGNEELLVWNMQTGKLDSAPILFVDSDPAVECDVIGLHFSDGSVVKVIYEHGFWDYDLNQYVYLDANAQAYIGHTFAKQSGESLAKVQLVDVVVEKAVAAAFSPVTAGHLCYFVNGMLSMPGGVGGLFNIFEVDPQTMTYDYEAMARDIQTYGLFTYEEMNEIVPLPEAMFDAAGGAYLKVSIGKGNMTLEDLVYMIGRYAKFFQ